MPRTLSLRTISAHFRSKGREELLLQGSLLVGIASLMLLIGTTTRPETTIKPVKRTHQQELREEKGPGLLP